MSLDSFDTKLRAKIIGATIREARIKADKGLEECSSFLKVPADRIDAFELGQEFISLPELEILSYFLDIPIDHFLIKGSSLEERGEKAEIKTISYFRLRNRWIGANVRQARLEAKMDLEQLSLRSGIEPQILNSYELGELPIPFVTLETLCPLLNRSIEEFLDQQGAPGLWNAQQRALKDFLDLPVELQVFISKPSHRPYLNLAVRLSNMSVDQLRAVAEGLLEITY